MKSNKLGANVSHVLMKSLDKSFVWESQVCFRIPSIMFACSRSERGIKAVLKVRSLASHLVSDITGLTQVCHAHWVAQEVFGVRIFNEELNVLKT